MNKEYTRLIHKFTLIFFNFTIVSLIVSGFMTYVNQMETYTRMCRENSRRLGAYLTGLMEADGDDMIAYKELFMDNYRDIVIPPDFDEYHTAWDKYEDVFSKTYPGMALDKDIPVSELSEEVRDAYFAYYHEYWVLTFEQAKEKFGQAYVYFLVMGDPRARVENFKPGEDPAFNVFYLIDGERTAETYTDKDGNKKEKLYLGDTYYNERESHLVEWNTFDSGKTLDEYYEWNNQYGHTYTFYTPLIIKGQKLGLVCVDVEVQSINEAILTNTLLQISSIGLVLVICVVSMLWFINKFYIKKIQLLEKDVRDFANTKDASVADVLEKNVDSDDELGALAKQTAASMRELVRYISDVTRMTSEKEHFSAELNVATKIQSDMLPTDFPKRNDLDMYALMSPAKEVGGDFYDFFFIDSDHLALVMADVSGKGVPAALFMVIAKTLISNQTLSGKGTPASILEDVNFRLCENNESGMFITAWLGILTLSTGELIYSNAGHEYPAIKRKNGKYELIEADNCPPLATIEDIEYVDEHLQLKPGDSLFLYTDGVPEAKNSMGKHLGTSKMLEIINAAPDLEPYEMLTGLKELIDDFARGTDTFDDITMMCVHYFGK